MTASTRIRMITGVLWMLVALGPVLGLAALLRPVPAAQAQAGPVVPPGVTGMAEFAVTTHLTGPAGHSPSWIAPALPAFRLTSAALDGLSPSQRDLLAQAPGPSGSSLQAVDAVAVDPAGPNRWGVTVAVLRDGVPEAWQVTVADNGQGLLVEMLPAPVNLPPLQPGPIPDLSTLAVPDPGDPLTVAIQRFCDAYLSGDGELSRYLTTQSTLVPLPEELTTAELRRLATGPVDQRHLAALAEVRITRQDGTVLLTQLPLLMRRSDGRWEVSRILPALPIRPLTTQPTTATTTQGETSS